MTIKELNKLIEDEVSVVIREPIKEPVVQRPIQKQPIVYKVALTTEEEIDEALFGKKD